MSSAQAKEYGIVDEVLGHIPNTDAKPPAPNA